MKKTTIIILILILAIAAIVFSQMRNNGGEADTPSLSSESSEAESKAALEKIIKSPERAAVSAAVAETDLTETYVNEAYRFSIKYPAKLNVSSFESADGSGYVILIADLQTGYGVQIFISPYADSSDVTAERIRQDVPGITIKNPQEVLLGQTGKGVAFTDGTGVTANRQVWFASKGQLYQLTAPMDFDDTLRRMLDTWIFM
ncbi:MAG: hypothetical protein A3G52_00715 [Candidatus Taylorbacteria bacterium RIFCSPLOWO2_12_FULL_43_20]|uniref:Uncharacterized protein n=1 Tax=Candidatus Taylorbacteria bacterium RIFCSPLOWO2_12_FULL_43_20 TaxID=1802332 RepID=A0A1G2NZU4_9BACT|nr:MAG: hypothetical protein A3G52_00715 [Candidatus Taylorbacteria bacterium RIFCSPLOWO2_12_FULL_43_20]